MRNFFKRFLAGAMAVAVAVTMTGCGQKAQFNTVGVSYGNFINGATVSYQNDNTYYIKDGDIFKTEDIAKEGRKIIEGDVSSLNVAGEKIYFYDNEISTICKANTEGDLVERIAEVYCDDFIVNKDNIFASILTGQGGDDLRDPDNYNVSKLKITNKKVTNQKQGVVIENAKLMGSYGDYLYVEKKDEKTKKIGLYMVSLTGEEVVKMIDLPKDANVLVKGNNIYVLGKVKGTYGLHVYNGNGEFQKTIAKTMENPVLKMNAINTDNDYIYFEDYAKTKQVVKTVKYEKVKVKRTKAEKKAGKPKFKKKKVVVKSFKPVHFDNIVRISFEDIEKFLNEDGAKAPKKEIVYKGKFKANEFLLSRGANAMLIKERKAKSQLEPAPWTEDWKVIEKSLPVEE